MPCEASHPCHTADHPTVLSVKLVFTGCCNKPAPSDCSSTANVAMHGAAVGLCCTHDASTLKWMNHSAQVTVRDTELQQEVRVVNSGERDLSFTAALHSYFRVGDIMQVCDILHPADCTM